MSCRGELGSGGAVNGAQLGCVVKQWRIEGRHGESMGQPAIDAVDGT